MDGEEDAVEDLDGGVIFSDWGFMYLGGRTVRRRAVARRVVADHMVAGYTLSLYRLQGS